MARPYAGPATIFETAATESTDTASVLYTSGTAGTPKGAELTHANTALTGLLSTFPTLSLAIDETELTWRDNTPTGHDGPYR